MRRCGKRMESELDETRDRFRHVLGLVYHVRSHVGCIKRTAKTAIVPQSGIERSLVVGFNSGTLIMVGASSGRFSNPSPEAGRTSLRKLRRHPDERL